MRVVRARRAAWEAAAGRVRDRPYDEYTHVRLLIGIPAVTAPATAARSRRSATRAAGPAAGALALGGRL